jgi:biopolymer transport protein ExbD
VRFSAAGPRERLLPLDMTPMIDIVFQLLIFFLATTELVRTTRHLLDLPQERGREAELATALAVAITATGEVLVGGAPADRERVRAATVASLQAEPGGVVLLRADRAAPAAALNEAVAGVQAGGGARIRLVVDPGGGGAR